MVFNFRLEMAILRRLLPKGVNVGFAARLNYISEALCFCA